MIQQNITGFTAPNTPKSGKIRSPNGRKARRVGSKGHDFSDNDEEMENKQKEGWTSDEDNCDLQDMEHDDDGGTIEVLKVVPPEPKEKSDKMDYDEYDGDDDDEAITDGDSDEDEDEKIERQYRELMAERRAEKEAKMKEAKEIEAREKKNSNSSASEDSSNSSNSNSSSSSSSSSSNNSDSSNSEGSNNTENKEGKGQNEDKVHTAQKGKAKHAEKNKQKEPTKEQEMRNTNQQEQKDNDESKTKGKLKESAEAGNQQKEGKSGNAKEKNGKDDKNRKGKSSLAAATSQENDTQKQKPTSAKQKHQGRTVSKTNTTTRSKSPLIYKTVNSKSKNRRQCKKTKGPTNEGSSTPEAGNKTRRKHTFVSRVTFKLTVPADQDMKASTMKVIKEMMKAIKKADKSFQFYPWAEDDSHMSRLHKPEDIKTMKDMQPYSSRLFTYKNNDSQVLYPMFQIGHDIALEDIRREIREWAETNSCNIFWNMLQCESSVEVGFFCYAPKPLEPGALADEISDMIGIQVGLRWKVVSTGKRGKIPDNKKVFALVVEVNKKEKYTAQAELIKFFGRNIKETHEYPNGVRLRFVKNKSDAINTVEAAKLDRLRERQRAFLKAILSCETEDIVQLDYSPNEGEPTLRQMIMGIKSNVYKNTPLFHSVDLDWRGEGHIFTYSPKMEEEAECMVRTLLPYLSHKYPLYDVEAYFTNDAIARCSNLEVDQKTGLVKQSYDDDFNAEEEDLIIGFDLTIDIEKEKATLQRPNKDKQAPMPEDDDSVSTLGERRTTVTQTTRSSGATSTFTPNPPPRVHRRNIDGDDNVSVISGTSTVTMQTITMLDSKIESQTAAINKRLDLMMSKLFGNEATNTSAPDDQNGTSDTGHGTSKAGEGNNASSGGVSQN